ncbi:cysteine protease [Leptospira ognonensis]|uniref:Cysteine protease n=1 Tax=Leptospira ognonensis TaxID=2484945 RepID=A0A4R9K881_9LEPT|nr:C1 family peptidase [Leptospira ognonensis]TGL61872.1 cysteine protease [Leptospira ognonensis]
MKIQSQILSLAILLLSLDPVFTQEFDPSSVRSPDCKPGVFNCGYKPAPKEIQDSIPLKRDFNSFEDLPNSVDLSSKMPPVGNQGQQNSCVAWASGYAIKSYMAKNGGKFSSYDPPFSGGQGKNVFSPAFIYNQQNGGKDEGLYYYKTMEFLQKSGVAPWSSMPYTDKDYKKQPPEAVKKEALQYKIKSFSRLNIKNPDDMKRVLAGGNVVLFGIIIDDAFYKVKGSEVYDENGGQSYGGHAMTIVGYDDSKTSKSGKKGAFKFQNSWGTNWADKGFGWISYSMLAKVGQEAYAMIDDTKTTTPTVTPAPAVTKPLSAPTDIKASRGEFPSKIVLTWLASDKAISYLIERKDENKFNELAYSNVPTYSDTNVSPNSTYSYRISAISDEETSPASKEIEGFTSAQSVSNGKLEQVVGVNGKSYMEGSSAKIALAWSEIEGATGYMVSKIGSSKRWKTVGNVTTASFVDTSPSQDETNVYRICATIKSKKAGDWSESYGVDVGSDEVAPGQVADLQVSVGEYADKIKVSWNASPGATGYYLYRFDENAEVSGQFEVSGTSYDDMDKALLGGSTFAYTVIAVNEVGYSEPSEFAFGNIDPELSKRSAGATLSPPSKVSFELGPKDKKLKIKWSPVKDAGEYYIYRKLMKAKSKKEKYAFVNSVPGNQTTYTETFSGNPGDLYLYSVRSKSEFGSESKDSKPISVFLNPEQSAVSKRALSLEEIPSTFLGNWSGFYWNPKSGPQKLLVEVTGANQDFKATLKINDKVAKQFQGSWTPGSTGIKAEGFQLDLSREIKGSSLVKLNKVAELGEETEYSFSKD